jgi:hypothetical protein
MTLRIPAALLLGLAALLGTDAATGSEAESRPAADRTTEAYEVWMVDQTDSRQLPSGGGYGGYLHIHPGRTLEREGAASRAETTDLGGAVSALCEKETGAPPVRPHMLTFNGGDRLNPTAGRYAVLSWVVSGHVTILDATTRRPVACHRTAPGSGGARQAHAAWPTPDGRHIIVANQNGRQVERISADWGARSFAQEPEATLKLYEGQTPSGAPRQAPGVRPDNAPICVRPTSDGSLTFVSLRGGGAFVIDHEATPMRIVAEYDRDHVADYGCGQIEARGKMYLDAGAGAGVGNGGHAVYAVDLDALDREVNPPNTPAPRLVYDRGGEGFDAHGFALTSGDRHLLTVDRAANDVTVVDVKADEVVGRFSLAGPVSDDPAPDLMVPAPDGRHLFVSLRGPAPLSGGHDAVRGSTPGVGVVRLGSRRRSGELVSVAPARRDDALAADPHAIAVRVVGRR